jgi:hypothetical protein
MYLQLKKFILELKLFLFQDAMLKYLIQFVVHHEQQTSNITFDIIYKAYYENISICYQLI